jgi:uncharacterized protein (DUF58 family)
VAARIAWQNLAAGDRVGGIVIGNEQQTVHRPYRTTKSVARFLNDVANFNQRLNRVHRDPWTSINEGMLRVRRLTHTNYRIFVLSDFSGDLDTWREHLHQLARHNQVVVVHIHDPLEEHLPPADHYMVTDGTERLQLYTGDVGLRARYAERFAQHTDALMNLCSHESMRYIAVLTGDERLDQLAWR